MVLFPGLLHQLPPLLFLFLLPVHKINLLKNMKEKFIKWKGKINAICNGEKKGRRHMESGGGTASTVPMKGVEAGSHSPAPLP
jgi:hypothetical protein